MSALWLNINTIQIAYVAPLSRMLLFILALLPALVAAFDAEVLQNLNINPL